MEAEVLDAMTGEQIGAVVESKQGSRIPFANLGDWTAAKKVMDSWAYRFQKRLSEQFGELFAITFDRCKHDDRCLLSGQKFKSVEKYLGQQLDILKGRHEIGRQCNS